MNIITGMQLYWLTRCDAIKAAVDCDGGFILLAALGFIAAVITTIGMVCERDDVAKYTRLVAEKRDYTDELEAAQDNVRALKYARKLAFAGTVTFVALWLGCRLIHPFVPTTKEMAAIIVIPKVANSESVQGLGEGVVELAKAWMQELKPDKVKESAKAVGEVVKEAARCAGGKEGK